MDEVGPVMLSEAGVQADKRRFRVVAIVAGILALPFAAAHLTIAGWLIPQLETMFHNMGGTLPAGTQLLINLSHHGVLAVVMLVVDVAIFALMYVLARRYWVGLLFAPIFAYMAISASLVPVLYAPMFNVINLVK